MKKQSNRVFVWLLSLLIAIPLFIALACISFLMAALGRIGLNKPVKPV